MIEMRKTATLFVACFAACALAFALAGCSSASTEEEEGSTEASTEEQADEDAGEDTAGVSTVETAYQGTVIVSDEGYINSAATAYTDGAYEAIVTVTDYGSFTIELDAESAPVSVSNFCSLAENGYYDGLALYRVVEDFCLQGGTLGNSASGSDENLYTILGEFSDNGVDNALADTFERGVVAMARSSEENSASSTFFITLADNDTVGASLDGAYAAFGTIDEEGMEVVDAIVEATADKVDDSGMGIIADEDDMPIIESIEIVEG